MITLNKVFFVQGRKIMKIGLNYSCIERMKKIMNSKVCILLW